MSENQTADTSITIDGKSYDLDQLNEAARAQLANIRYVDREIEDVKNKLAVLQAARQFYAGVLNKELPQ